MSILTKVEEIHNKASDTRFVWFPFLWMKPKPSEFLRFKKIVLMSVVFGFYYGTFFTLKKVLLGGVDLFESLPKAVPLAIAIFFVWFNLVTATFWNRRAKRLYRK
jgi:hypothetical protein